MPNAWEVCLVTVGRDWVNPPKPGKLPEASSTTFGGGCLPGEAENCHLQSRHHGGQGHMLGTQSSGWRGHRRIPPSLQPPARRVAALTLAGNQFHFLV